MSLGAFLNAASGAFPDAVPGAFRNMPPEIFLNTAPEASPSIRPTPPCTVPRPATESISSSCSFFLPPKPAQNPINIDSTIIAVKFQILKFAYILIPPCPLQRASI
jgi:hypothetical protein